MAVISSMNEIALALGTDGLCVCVCSHSILSGRQTWGCTSWGRTGEGHPQFLLLPFAVLALTFVASRIQPFLYLVERKVDFLVVVVVSHIQRIACQPEKYYFIRWPILSWSAEQEIK